jgi:hypothetical protein
MVTRFSKSIHVMWQADEQQLVHISSCYNLQHTIMPLQLPPPLQTPLHIGQAPLQELANPPTACDVVRAAANHQ